VIVPDTSVWVAFLRSGSEEITGELSAALDRREVLTCDPVLAELTAGARPVDRADLIASLAGLPWAELDRSGWQSVGLLAAELRDRGEVVPLTDLEIAVAAHAGGAVLWTSDQHFKRIEPLLSEFAVRFLGRP
jgi:predicted nucleic acid-binding protein